MGARAGKDLFNRIVMDSATHKQKNAPMKGGRLGVVSVGQDQTAKLEPHPQLLVALGLLKTNPRPMSSSLKSTITPPR